MGKDRARVPSYRRHKASGQAIVALGGRQIYLGPFGSQVSKDEYDRIIAEWLANGRRSPCQPASITVSEVLADYLEFAEGYYRRPDGTPTPEIVHVKGAAKVLRRLYGHTQAADFGQLSLKACREALIGAGQARKTVNQNTQRLKRVLRWAVENELVPRDLYYGLQAVSGLRRGRSEARETDPVRPVPKGHVRRIRHLVSRPIRVMIDVQLLTGARAGEIVPLRPMDLDMSGPVWTATLAQHKTAHHGTERVIYFGPKAQKMLRPFLDARPPTSPIFSAAEAVEEQLRRRHEARKTPPQYGNRPGTNRKRRPMCKPGDAYTVCSYRRGERSGGGAHRACVPSPSRRDTRPCGRGSLRPRRERWAGPGGSSGRTRASSRRGSGSRPGRRRGLGLRLPSFQLKPTTPGAGRRPLGVRAPQQDDRREEAGHSVLLAAAHGVGVAP